MYKIILDQIAFKKINMSEYDKLSSLEMWILFFLVSVATSYSEEASLGLWALNTIFGAFVVYGIYLFLAFWFKRRGLWDGNGNILGLMITSSAMDILVAPAMMIHPILVGLLFLLSVAISVNALKGALDISISQILIVFLITLVVAFIIMIPLGFLIEMISTSLGIELPPIQEV